jgi:hypothetical protein
VKKRRKKISFKTKITIDKGMRDYSNDPYIKEKAEIANALIKRVGLPPTAK